VAAAMLAFARALGDFGATLMVAGNIPGRTQTASIAIYDAVQAGRLEQATSMALALGILAGAVLFLLARVGRGARW
jgi:molybdate transport system permease protein